MFFPRLFPFQVFVLLAVRLASQNLKKKPQEIFFLGGFGITDAQTIEDRDVPKFHIDV